MKAKMLGLVAAALLAGPMAASAAPIYFTEIRNDDSKFAGTFAFKIPSGTFVTEEILSVGGLLPGDKNYDGLTGEREFYGDTSSSNRIRLFTDEVGGSTDGGPDDPYFARVPPGDTDPDLGPLSYSGAYTNSAVGDKVWWRFSSLTDTGGRDGTFSGSFCFSTNANGCTSGSAPEPGTLALLGLGLAGLVASRRRKR